MAAASSKAPAAKPAAPRTTVRQQPRGGSAHRKKRR
jgi:hypothetical protein